MNIHQSLKQDNLYCFLVFTFPGSSFLLAYVCATSKSAANFVLQYNWRNVSIRIPASFSFLTTQLYFDKKMRMHVLPKYMHVGSMAMMGNKAILYMCAEIESFSSSSFWVISFNTLQIPSSLTSGRDRLFSSWWTYLSSESSRNTNAFFLEVDRKEKEL